MRPDALNQDFRELLEAFCEQGVEFVVVGGYAVAQHGHPRFTADFDVLVRPDPANAKRVVQALLAFGAPLSTHGVTETDFARGGTVYQMGQPPRRIDVLTSISAVPFEEAWSTRVEVPFGAGTVAFLGLEALIKNKRDAGRPKDLADVAALERMRKPRT